MVNDALRNHVTRVGFDLTLGKTHVAALVYIDVMIRASRAQAKVKTGRAYIDTRAVVDLNKRRAHSHFATGTSGLIERGLIVHLYQPAFGQRTPAFHRAFKITPAGRFAIGLLREAGLYDEYAACLPEPTVLAS